MGEREKGGARTIQCGARRDRQSERRREARDARGPHAHSRIRDAHLVSEHVRVAHARDLVEPARDLAEILGVAVSIQQREAHRALAPWTPHVESAEA